MVVAMPGIIILIVMLTVEMITILITAVVIMVGEMITIMETGDKVAIITSETKIMTDVIMDRADLRGHQPKTGIIEEVMNTLPVMQ
jgi:hypothetical protein